MMKPVVYLAHPVGAESIIGVNANIARARRWLRWLVENTDWAIVASWMPYVETLDEGDWRARGLADDCAVLERCDAIFLCGGRRSAGMEIECREAIAAGLYVIDVAVGDDEPWAGLETAPIIEQAKLNLNERLSAASAS